MSEAATTPGGGAGGADGAIEGPVIDSRATFVAALNWGFDSATAQGARRIVCCDPDFELWDWDDVARMQALGAWMRLPQRQLVLLARSFEALPRRFPRFSAWRADWSHAISGWVAPEELAARLPRVLVADRKLSVHLVDAQRWRGRASVDQGRAQQWCDDIDAFLQRSAQGLAVNVLGL